jgi:hypothetical protein
MFFAHLFFRGKPGSGTAEEAVPLADEPTAGRCCILACLTSIDDAFTGQILPTLNIFA